jgi:small subunit ribosomal protein S21
MADSGTVQACISTAPTGTTAVPECIFFKIPVGSVLTWAGRWLIYRAPKKLRNQTKPTKNHRMRGVTMKKGEPVDRALKRLKTKLDSEGILEEMRRRRAFETPTERKQRKLRTASKRNKIRWRFSNAPAAVTTETAE